MTTRTAYFRPSEAKDVIGVSRATIYNWQKRGLISIHKVSGMAFVSMEECREVIEGLGDQLGDQKAQCAVSPDK